MLLTLDNETSFKITGITFDIARKNIRLHGFRVMGNELNEDIKETITLTVNKELIEIMFNISKLCLNLPYEHNLGSIPGSKLSPLDGGIT